MQPRTRDHLASARRNGAVARRLIDDADSSPISAEWAVIAAFYAALHFVNAYLWEMFQLEPANHAERVQLVTRFAILRSVARSYAALEHAGFQARYTPGFRVEPGVARHLVHVDLSAIEGAALSAIVQDV
jgi:hypothetical protein